MKNNKNNIIWFFGLLLVVGLLVFFPNQEKEPIAFMDAMNQEYPDKPTYQRMVVVDSTGPEENAIEVTEPAVISHLLETGEPMTMIPSVDLPKADYRIELYLQEEDYIGHVLTIGEKNNAILIEGTAYNIVSENPLLEEMKKMLNEN